MVCGSDDEIGNGVWLINRRRSRWRRHDLGQQLQCGLSSPTLSASLLLHAAEPSILASSGEREFHPGDTIVSSPAPVCSSRSGSCACLVIS